MLLIFVHKYGNNVLHAKWTRHSIVNSACSTLARLPRLANTLARSLSTKCVPSFWRTANLVMPNHLCMQTAWNTSMCLRSCSVALPSWKSPGHENCARISADRCVSFSVSLCTNFLLPVIVASSFIRFCRRLGYDFAQHRSSLQEAVRTTISVIRSWARRKYAWQITTISDENKEQDDENYYLQVHFRVLRWRGDSL